jgi:putative tRNA adenosine deaminase-associated protein
VFAAYGGGGRVSAQTDRHDGHDDGIDFALAAYRDGDEWEVEDLAHDHLDDIDTLAEALRRLPGSSAVALVAVEEEFFVIVRVSGPRTQVLLSDASAAEDWDLAASALDFLGLADLDDEEVAAGDLDLLGDLGLDESEMVDLLDDADLYPDEMLSDVASTLGFGELFDDIVGLSPA